MARKARSDVLYDGCYTHSFSRSIDKRKIFKDNEDFEFFINLLFEIKIKNHFRIYHYCLMQTHFHVVAEIQSLEKFSQGLQQIKWKYTRWFNAKYRRWGPLWRERFKSMLIEDERYLLACGRYIEQNPLKAGIVKEVSKWRYSSAQHYEGLKKDKLVDNYQSKGLPKDIDISKEDDFSKGWLIGSGWFKYKMTKGIVVMTLVKQEFFCVDRAHC